MLKSLWSLCGFKAGCSDQSYHSETGHVFPVHFIDQAGLIRASIINYTLRFNDVLSPSKLHSSLVELLEIGDWRKLGGRLRRTVGENDPGFEIPPTDRPSAGKWRYRDCCANSF